MEDGEEISRLTKLLYVSSVFSRESEIKSAIQQVPGLTKQNCTDILEFGKAIHPVHTPKSFFEKKLSSLKTCEAAAEKWRKTGKVTDEVVNRIVDSTFFSNSQVTRPDFFSITKPVGVFWDFHSVPLPLDYSEILKKKIYDNVKDALRELGIPGPIKMFVIGDVNFIGQDNLKCFKDQGITFVEAPLESNQKKVTSDKQFLVEMFWLIHQNFIDYNEGSVIVGVTNDLDFKMTMQQLRPSNHLMIVAHEPGIDNEWRLTNTAFVMGGKSLNWKDFFRGVVTETTWDSNLKAISTLPLMHNW